MEGNNVGLDTLVRILGLLTPILLIWIGYLYKRKGELEQQVAEVKRENYRTFFDILRKAMEKGKNAKPEDFIDEMRRFSSNLILFGSPKTIKSFNKFMIFSSKVSQLETSPEIFKHVGKLVKSMRVDIGLSNDWLRYYEILQPFIRGNFKEELKKLRRRK